MVWRQGLSTAFLAWAFLVAVSGARTEEGRPYTHRLSQLFQRLQPSQLRYLHRRPRLTALRPACCRPSSAPHPAQPRIEVLACCSAVDPIFGVSLLAPVRLLRKLPEHTYPPTHL